MKIINEEITRRIEEETSKKVEEASNKDGVQSKMQPRIEGGRKTLIESLELWLQKEKEEKLKGDHRKIPKEVDIQIPYGGEKDHN